MSESESASPQRSRRGFLANAVLGISGALGLGTLGLRFLEFLYPVVPPEEEVEIAVGTRAAIPEGGGLVVHLATGHVALSAKKGQVRAFSAVCTHLGCLVEWQPTKEHCWFCPCHLGAYDSDGNVVSGPPPRGLQEYPVVERDGQLFIKMRIRPRELAT